MLALPAKLFSVATFMCATSSLCPWKDGKVCCGHNASRHDLLLPGVVAASLCFPTDGRVNEQVRTGMGWDGDGDGDGYGGDGGERRRRR